MCVCDLTFPNIFFLFSSFFLTTLRILLLESIPQNVGGICIEWKLRFKRQSFLGEIWLASQYIQFLEQYFMSSHKKSSLIKFRAWYVIPTYLLTISKTIFYNIVHFRISQNSIVMSITFLRYNFEYRTVVFYIDLHLWSHTDNAFRKKLITWY